MSDRSSLTQRHVTGHFACRLPRPLPAHRLRGLLDDLDHPREQLITALVAVHAVGVGELRSLRLADLDRGRGTLKVHRAGSIFTIMLDEMITGLINVWLHARAITWPKTSSPFLFVSSYTVTGREPMSRYGVTTLFRTLGIPARQLRVDRILDEARHSADPVQLIRVFGLGVTTAVRYVRAAHPDRSVPDPAGT